MVKKARGHCQKRAHEEILIFTQGNLICFEITSYALVADVLNRVIEIRILYVIHYHEVTKCCLVPSFLFYWRQKI